MMLYISVQKGLFEYWIDENWKYKIYMETPNPEMWRRMFLTGEPDPTLGMSYGLKLRAMMLLSIGLDIPKSVFGRQWLSYKERTGRRLIYDPDKNISVNWRRRGDRVRAELNFYSFKNAMNFSYLESMILSKIKIKNKNPLDKINLKQIAETHIEYGHTAKLVDRLWQR